jgi:hypothetical protein
MVSRMVWEPPPSRSFTQSFTGLFIVARVRATSHPADERSRVVGGRAVAEWVREHGVALPLAMWS